MSTYQAASGAGAEGMAELENGIRQFVKGEEVTNEFFAYPLPFNVIPQVRPYIHRLVGPSVLCDVGGRLGVGDVVGRMGRGGELCIVVYC
jgi:hypothetical protein